MSQGCRVCEAEICIREHCNRNIWDETQKAPCKLKSSFVSKRMESATPAIGKKQYFTYIFNLFEMQILSLCPTSLGWLLMGRLQSDKDLKPVCAVHTSLISHFLDVDCVGRTHDGEGQLWASWESAPYQTCISDAQRWAWMVGKFPFLVLVCLERSALTLSYVPLCTEFLRIHQILKKVGCLFMRPDCANSSAAHVFS